MSTPQKIVLIGPIYPCKGGISHYTGLMYRALSAKHDVYMMSYKLQYPKILFKKEQKDYNDGIFNIDNADFFINTANPLNWIRTAKRIRGLSPNLVIIQWWHPYFTPCYWSICKLLGKIDVLFVCHNVLPHERFPLDRFLTKCVLACGNFFIVQSSQDEADLKTIRTDAVYKKTVHPTYNAFRLLGLTPKEGRNRLQLSDEQKILLFFGFVREYKGLKHLLNAMPSVISRLPDVKLLIAGDFGGNKEQYLAQIESLGIGKHLEIHDRYIPDNEVEEFFVASDLVVLPYESATQSGIVQIAYGFEKPVIVTDVGGLPEVVLDGETGYIVEAGNDEQLAEKIVRFFTEDKAQVFREGIQREAYRYSWERMVEIIDSMR